MLTGPVRRVFIKRNTRRTLSLAATSNSARRLSQHPFDAEMIAALPSAAPRRKRQIYLPKAVSRQRLRRDAAPAPEAALRSSWSETFERRPTAV